MEEEPQPVVGRSEFEEASVGPVDRCYRFGDLLDRANLILPRRVASSESASPNTRRVVTGFPSGGLEQIQYLTNALGDVYGRVIDGREERVNPDDWNWGTGQPEKRRSLEEIEGLPYFTVNVEEGLSIPPGPKPKRPKPFFRSDAGAAPPARATSNGGASGKYSRLSDALGYAVWSLPRNPQSNPFRVDDLVAGRLIRIDYSPPPPQPEGKGLVYVIEDGLGVKIGYTVGPAASRVADLQTGNPRLISVIATISGASDIVELHLHNQFAKWNVRGEWFDRSNLLALAREEGGWNNLIHSRLHAGDWHITVFPPYR